MNSKLVPAEEELKRNPQVQSSDVQHLRDWLKKQPHLPNITDGELILFFHCNYFRLEPTKKTIEAFYSMRTHIPEFFSNRSLENDDKLKKTTKVVINVPLSQRSRDGYKVFYSGLQDFNPSSYDYCSTAKLLYMIFDLWVFLEGTHEGYVVVINAKGGQMGHAARVPPVYLKRATQYLQEAAPIRLKGVHFININPVVNAVINVAKPIMKKELIDLIHLHTKLESLESFGIPVDILPNEAGGKAGSQVELHERQIEKLKEHADFFNDEEKLRRVNESKRPGKAKTASDLFGAEGSFKTLDLD